MEGSAVGIEEEQKRKEDALLRGEAGGKGTLPQWAERMRRSYESGEHSLFILHGNVYDLFPYREKFLWLRDFLINALAGGKDLVLSYNLSEGIRLATPEMAREFQRFLEVLTSLGQTPPGLTHPALFGERPDLIKDPSLALALIEKLLETRNRIFVLIEHAEKIVPHQDVAFLSFEDRRNLATLQRWAFHPSLMSRDNIVILVTRNLGDIHRDLRSNPMLDAVEIPYPDLKEREDFIETAASSDGISLEAQPSQLAFQSAGLNRVALFGLFREARKSNVPLSLSMVKERKIEIFREEYGGLVEVIEPEFGLDLVGGLDYVKQDLREVIRMLKEGERRECPMGVGLIGPPGTGKSMIAKAIAKEAGLPFLKIGDIRDKFVGESERNAERVITLLRSVTPVVVFVDEIDQAFGSRGERGDSGVSQRIWAKFAEIQGDSAYRGLILWLWATNRPDIMDEATKRPGRLGDLKIPLFFAAQDPEAVIRASARKNNIILKVDDLSPVLEKVKGYSGAELEAVVLSARWFARRAGRKKVLIDDLLSAAKDYIPARNDKMIRYMEILAILEASSLRMLPPEYRQNYDRSQLMEQAHQLRMELVARGLI